MPAPKKTTAKKATKAAVVAPTPEKSVMKGSGTGKAVTETAPTAPAAVVAPTKPAAAPRTITHDMIAKRAYEIYASRGYAPGNPDADWAEAERQLKAGL